MNLNPDGDIQTMPVRTGYHPADYVYGTPEENIEKTRRLRVLAKLDPSMGKRIAAYTNQYVARAANSSAWRGNNGKDLYALGQDAYLRDMAQYEAEEENVNTLRNQDEPKTLRDQYARARRTV